MSLSELFQTLEYFDKTLNEYIASDTYRLFNYDEIKTQVIRKKKYWDIVTEEAEKLKKLKTEKKTENIILFNDPEETGKFIKADNLLELKIMDYKMDRSEAKKQQERMRSWDTMIIPSYYLDQEYRQEKFDSDVMALIKNLPNIKHMTFKVEIRFYRDLKAIYDHYEFEFLSELRAVLDRLEKEEEMRPKVDLVIDHIPRKKIPLDKPYLKELYAMLPKPPKQVEIVKKEPNLEDVEVNKEDLDKFDKIYDVIYQNVLGEIQKDNKKRKLDILEARKVLLDEIDKFSPSERRIYENGAYQSLLRDDEKCRSMLDSICKKFFKMDFFDLYLKETYPKTTMKSLIDLVYTKFDWYLTWQKEQDFLFKLRQENNPDPIVKDLSFDKYKEFVSSQVEKYSKTTLFDHQDDSEQIDWLNDTKDKQEVPFYTIPIDSFYKKIKSLH